MPIIISARSNAEGGSTTLPGTGPEYVIRHFLTFKANRRDRGVPARSRRAYVGLPYITHVSQKHRLWYGRLVVRSAT